MLNVYVDTVKDEVRIIIMEADFLRTPLPGKIFIFFKGPLESITRIIMDLCSTIEVIGHTFTQVLEVTRGTIDRWIAIISQF